MIVRLPGSYPTRCRAVIHNGVATFFAVAPSLGPSTYDQTKAALAVVDKTLAEVGSSKDRILTATVFIADMAQPRLGRMGRSRQRANARLRLRRPHRRLPRGNAVHRRRIVTPLSLVRSAAGWPASCGISATISGRRTKHMLESPRGMGRIGEPTLERQRRNLDIE